MVLIYLTIVVGMITMFLLITLADISSERAVGAQETGALALAV